VPTGNITFKDGATTLGTGTLDANGVATFITSSLSVGSHNITAEYSGDGTVGGSTSPVLVQVVNKLGSTTTLTAAPNPSTFQQTVTFTATVTVNLGGSNVKPTGTVTFKDGTTTLGTGSLNATFTTSTLSVGSHNITAVYAGDGNVANSTSPVATQIVRPGNPEQPQYQYYFPFIGR
jgi:hypothetical protein